MYTRTAKCDVNEGIGAADAPLDPDSDGWEKDSNEAEEHVAAAHG